MPRDKLIKRSMKRRKSCLKHNFKKLDNYEVGKEIYKIAAKEQECKFH
jgi:hypothetical protein